MCQADEYKQKHQGLVNVSLQYNDGHKCHHSVLP